MNYPNGVKKSINEKFINYKNRGMTLEENLNAVNQYYREKKIAFIYKKPTPIKIVKVDYPSRDKAVIKEAYFDKPSTTDYNGLYRGCYIDFEAKETLKKTSFPLDNIHKHQIEHIRNITINHGICFLIIRFTSINETYLLRGEDFLNFLDTNPRKSIPLSLFKEKGYLIKEKLKSCIDYLEIIDKIYGGNYDKK